MSRYVLVVFACWMLGVPGAVGFEPYPDKVDLMVITAHPDDETVMGGLIAHYAACEKRKVVIVVLTSGEWGNGLPHPTEPGQPIDCSYDDSDHPCFEGIAESDLTYPCYYREGEMARAAIAYGMSYQPIMPRFKDISGLQPWGSPDPAFEFWGGEDKVVDYLAGQIKRFRPDVIVTMPMDGYNGNPQHMGASHGAAAAVEVAGQATQAASDAGFAVDAGWQVKKLYALVSAAELEAGRYDQTVTMDWTGDCRHHPGTAQILAARGTACHQSQGHAESCPASTTFALLDSTVGDDDPGAVDLFGNLP